MFSANKCPEISLNIDYIVVFILAAMIVLPKIGIVDLSICPFIVWCGYLIFFKFEYPQLVLPRLFNEIMFKWLLLFILSLLSFVINDSVSELIIGKPLRQIILLFVTVPIFMHEKEPVFTAIYAIFFAAIINSFVVLLQYGLTAAGLSDLWLIMPGFNEEVNVMYRKPGLTAGYPTAGMLCLFGLFSGLTIIQIKYKKIIVLGLLLVVCALFITSRIALYLGFISVFLWSVVFFRNVNTRRSLIALLLLFLATVMLLLSYGIIHDDTTNVMLELFINYSKSSSLETESSSALIDSWKVLPSRISTILIGNGYKAATDELKTVDSGYQIIFFGGGFIYFIIFYATYINYWRLSLVGIKTFHIRFLFILMFTLAFIAEFKGGSIFTRVVGDCLIMCTVASVAQHIKDTFSLQN